MALYARKANIETVIAEDKVDKYVAEGYTVYDNAGNIVKETAPDNLTTLKQAYTSHVAELSIKDAEIARLKDELARAEQTLKEMEAKAEKAEPKAVASTEENSTEKPKRTRTRRSAGAEVEA